MFSSVLYVVERKSLFQNFLRRSLTNPVVVGAAGSGLWDLVKSVGKAFVRFFESNDQSERRTERGLLIDVAHEAGMDIALVLRAASQYGDAFIRKHIQDGVRFWYKDQGDIGPVDAFTYNVRNKSYDRNSGQIVFSIDDYYSGLQEMTYSSPVFGLEPGQEFVYTEKVNVNPLPRAGLKKVRIIQQPENFSIKTSDLFILDMKP